MTVRSSRGVRSETNHLVASAAFATLLALVLTTVLSSCSLLATPPPPASVAAATSTLMKTLRSTAGITAVTVTATPRHALAGDLDKPGEWMINTYATARRSTIDVRFLVAAVDSQLAIANRVALTGATLHLTGDGLPHATLGFDRSGSSAARNHFADAVIRLRTLTGIQEVGASFGGPKPVLTVSSPDRWADTVRQLRALDGFGTGSLASVVVQSHGAFGSAAAYTWITIDRSTPDDAALAGLREVVGQPGVTSLTYDAVRPPSSLDNWRPYLTVVTKFRAEEVAVLSRLTRFGQKVPPVPDIPRSTFNLSAMDGDSDQEMDGYLGLPLGSPAPRDLVPAPRPTPAPADPVVEAAKLAANLRLVKNLLDDAGDTAGIRGTPSINAVPCDSGTGTQVVGTVLIPIFQIAHRADAAYAAIISTWKRQGYKTEDHATVTEIRTGGPLRELTIQGTPDGISITATSHC